MTTYLERPWTKAYDDYVPHTIDYPDWSMGDALAQAAKRAPNTTAIIMSSKLPVIGRVKKEVTYAELQVQAQALATALQDMGIEKGARIALLMPNCPQFVISWLGILLGGYVTCGLNPTYPAQRLADMIKDADAKAIITLSLFYPLVQKIREDSPLEQVIVTNIKEGLNPLAAFLFGIAKEKKEGHRVEVEARDHQLKDLLTRFQGKQPSGKVSPQDVAIFQYTGGTTGPSKAAVSTHSAIVSNAIQQKAWLSGTDMGEPGEMMFGALPFFHVFGMIAVIVMSVYSNATMILVPNPRDIDDVIENIHTYRPSLFPGVPALYNAINENPHVQSGEIDMSSLRHCTSGSAPLPKPTKERFEELTGGKLCEAYGMSEMPTATHVNPLYGENITGSVGLPITDTLCCIVSAEDPNQMMSVGEVGEIAIGGPQQMLYYYGRPTATKNSFVELEGHRWFLTGDLGYMDERGYFYIVDRKKDMALIGGYNVYPNQVDQVLIGHPAVKEVAVGAIPHPDKVGQEALKAWVVFNEGMSATPEELMEYAGQKLARYEIPSRYEFIEALPRSAVGKILRRELIRMEKEKDV